MPENLSVEGFSAFAVLKYLKVFECAPLWPLRYVSEYSKLTFVRRMLYTFGKAARTNADCTDVIRYKCVLYLSALSFYQMFRILSICDCRFSFWVAVFPFGFLGFVLPIEILELLIKQSGATVNWLLHSLYQTLSPIGEYENSNRGTETYKRYRDALRVSKNLNRGTVTRKLHIDALQRPAAIW